MLLKATNQAQASSRPRGPAAFLVRLTPKVHCFPLPFIPPRHKKSLALSLLPTTSVHRLFPASPSLIAIPFILLISTSGVFVLGILVFLGICTSFLESGQKVIMDVPAMLLNGS